MNWTFYVHSLLLLILISSSEHALAAGSGHAEAGPVTQHDVIPMLLLHCAVCHGARKQEGGLDLRSRASMLRGGRSGAAFVPEHPEESLLLKRLASEECPPRKRLTEAMVKPMEPDETERLAQWIKLGAPEVAIDLGVAGTPDDPLVHESDRAFWCFRPPQRPTVPKVQHSEQVQNPIDAFVLEKLEAKGLQLSPCADTLTLLRRASYDLTGLPPEPFEAQAFLVDQSPSAYEGLIDRLLASPRYGEKWGRHWLDVAGYADCEGRREQHLPRPYAWRYRDYVIRSLNVDKGYDRFLLEQLAGDDLVDYEHASEITQEVEDSVVATAFLRMAPDPTWANLTGFVPDRLEVIADSMDVLGSGVMGLTFKCARCHNHKFDPIPQRDYYRLGAIFKGAYDEHDWLKPEINGFGGALSVGLGERYLNCVTSVERQAWENRNRDIQKEIEGLHAAPKDAGIEKQIKEFEAKRQPEPRIMALWDRGETSPAYIYRRGNYLTAGGPVQAGVPAVLSGLPVGFDPHPPHADSKSTGRRLAFAKWLTQPNHPLTARVMVNRIWKEHFGEGLVRSLGNFGKMGERPSHPELLDWLATEFVRQGWSMKAMHRLIMTSNVYRQRSLVSDAIEQLDPENRLLSRRPLRRLEAEELRDSLLLIAGQLNETRFGRPEPVSVRADGLVQAGTRRSIYIEQLRKAPPSLLESFDFPAMNPNCLQRRDSLVAPQALHLLNDSGVRALAAGLAGRLLPSGGAAPARQVEQLYWIVLSRPPTVEEQAACSRLLADITEAWKTEKAVDADAKAMTTLCHTLMNSAAFLYVD